MTNGHQRATFYELQAANRRNSILLILLFMALVAFLGWGMDTFFMGFAFDVDRPLVVPFFTLFAVAFGALHATTSWFGGASQVLHATFAKPARPEDPLEKQFINVLEEMSIAAGLPVPKAYVVPDDDPNAFAVGRDPQHASIAVTRGLLQTLDRDELQGVIGHEMAHVKNLDIRAMTLVTALFGAVTLLSGMARRVVFARDGTSIGRSRNSRDSGGGGVAIMFVIWLLVGVLGPVLGRMLALAVSRSREYLADASGVELTRNPLGLASALRKISAAHEPTHLISEGSAHLCITDPRGLRVNDSDGAVADLFATHPPIARRIALLEEMAGAAPPGVVAS